MPQNPIKGVTRDRDRHGNVRLYFRRPGARKIRLPGPEGSPEFWAAYAEARAGEVNAAPPIKKAGRASFTWLCRSYYRSAAFRVLDPRTQRVRKLVLDDICRSHGDKPYAAMLPRHVRKLRDAKVDRPSAANAIVKYLRQVFAHAVRDELMNTNPAREVEYLASPGDGFHSWTPEEIEQYQARWRIGTQARLALDLLLYTGLRRSDVVRVGRPHERPGGWLHLRLFKGRNKRPVDLDIPILPVLRATLDASPCGELTYLATRAGRPFSADGFGNKFRRWCREAGLEGCSAHGLRKAGAATAAENGATEHQLMAIYGWLTPKEAARYTRAARNKKMAGEAMHLLAPQDGTPGETGNKSVPLESANAPGGTKSVSK